jgi:NAD(P)-dependent dehydrogenase (short-subunit alcohol dehydrogenase family)
LRIVLITGATSGFGKLMTQTFLAHGDLVVATGRNLKQRREIFEDEREKFGDRLVEFDLDVRNEHQVLEVANIIEKKFSSLDILINNAGYGLFGALEDFSNEQIKEQMDVNFYGTVLVTRSFLPLLRKKQGKIFNFSSVFGFMGFPLTSLYCASKFAVEGLSESLRLELSSFGVQVCLIQPGGFRTDFGKNLIWNFKNEHSIYDRSLRNYQNLHDYFAAKKKQHPLEVANGVLKLSKLKRIPMRKVFGQDGKFSYLLKTFLPEFFYFMVFEKIINKFFNKP